ncbi:MAG: hypothetical protein GOV00_03790 [Candidatus Altiarchaeota archaeon]|nr:hypothetical protein [Candidatus Altiarchaeota archaeon]
MKAQLSLEFLSITLISVIYLTAVLSLYSTVKETLEVAADKKTLESVSRWCTFISGRPEGTQILHQVKIYPGRWLEVSCGSETVLVVPSTETRLDVASICPVGFVNLTETGCLSIMREGEGVSVEKC